MSSSRFDRPTNNPDNSARADDVPGPKLHGFENMVGSSAALRAALDAAARVAEHPKVTVLIQGETGTGKELVARGVHSSSANGGEPFVAINCAAIPATLLESELFGHERGAFSGAHSMKRGLFEFAGRGTVFMDEIGELPLTLQPKLLRVLEERTVRRVGGLEELPVECRLIAATNRDLAERVAHDHFRADLYYRLNVMTIELPSLQERSEDIPELARHFVVMLCLERSLPAKTLSSAALDILTGYRWPGNIRELRNTIERAVILAEGQLIQPQHIVIGRRAPDQKGPKPCCEGFQVMLPPQGVTLEEAERQVIQNTLELTGGNQSRAARILGISRSRLTRKLEKFGLL